MLNIKNINTYFGKKKIIKDVSFKIEPGEIVGLVGSNGAGKTTIMKTILGLTKFTGEITFKDIPITENSHSGLQKVGALIEHPAVYPFFSGYENIRLYCDEEVEIIKLVEKLGMSSYIYDNVKNYSLGMKQKLGIAMALINNPDLVILDEPMNGLDIESTILIRNIIKDYSTNGKAFLISSHILSELQKIMTNIILIEHGHIILNKPVDEFIDNSHVKLITSDIKRTIDIFKAKGINFLLRDNYFVISTDDVILAQRILIGEEVYIIDLEKNDVNFEDKIIELISTKKGNEHGQLY
ncbi:ABC transporter-like protein [Weissella koreensis KACC 15510]|uniref:ABC transporter ATP-binding protein n=1 Tax=Weissella koreensis TaxID=165096 RepID=UPI0002175A5C|nr:ABC transporter ATP-binding protein [Weissella koreensis]AEJ23586.1 ABC transporter-like protein [Weissella koreensis KACC 15510]